MGRKKVTTVAELAKLGGKARAKKLKAADRKRIASMGGKAGGRGRPKKER